MAHMPEIKLISPLDQRTTMRVEVVLTRRCRLRGWLGKQFVHLAALAFGCRFEFRSVIRVERPD
jgi:hypothetical protein